MVIISGIGTFIALTLSICAIALSRRRYLDNKTTRAVVALSAECADITEKVEHLTKLFRKMSARVSQRDRRAKENGNDNRLDEVSGEEWKKQFRREHLDKISLAGRK